MAHWRGRDHDRLNAEQYPPWSVDETMAFLEGRCGLTDRLPGAVVEHHGNLFFEWRRAIESGALPYPFSVTHADAHADLGSGDPGYVYLMTDLLFKDVADRTNPDVGTHGLGDGNFLAFAVACRWISELTYVYNTGSGSDLLYLHMEDYEFDAAHIELKAVQPEELKRATGKRKPGISHREPLVPFTQTGWDTFQAPYLFDAICLAKSPSFTPRASDALFEEIRHRFIDEDAWPGNKN